MHINKDSIFSYVEMNIHDKTSKKKKTNFIGQLVNGMTYFNDNALSYADSF